MQDADRTRPIHGRSSRCGPERVAEDAVNLPDSCDANQHSAYNAEDPRGMTMNANERPRDEELQRATFDSMQARSMLLAAYRG